MKEEIKNAHDKAWNDLEEAGFSTGQRVQIRAAFASVNAGKLPFIKIDEFKDGQPKYYKSELKQISSLLFESEEEVNLANAMVFAIGNDINVNDFIHQIKAVFRILNIESNWSK